MWFNPFPSLFRRKLQNKLKEAEEALATSDSKYAALDKTKTRIATELEDLHLDLEKVRRRCGIRCGQCSQTLSPLGLD